MSNRLRSAKRMVVKIGSALLVDRTTGELRAAWLRALAGYIAAASGCALNVLSPGGNSRGAWLAGAVPHRGPGGAAALAGKNVAEMLGASLKAYLLWGIEPGFDSGASGWSGLGFMVGIILSLLCLKSRDWRAHTCIGHD